MSTGDRLWRWAVPRLGPLPARTVTWTLAFIFCAWIVLDVLVLQLSVGLARPTYDAMVRHRVWAAPPDPRIVIVDIDEASLARMAPEFGRWPWPRDTLATVLAHIEAQQPAAIVWDILFADADRLNPGGDAAFDAAVRRSAHSHFPVVRLPAANDVHSGVRQRDLPLLWRTPGAGTATVALIAPALPAVAAARLGYSNGLPDRDGVIRRHRHTEPLSDGGELRSLPASVVDAINSIAGAADRKRAGGIFDMKTGLIAWRGSPASYPRVPFADVFAQAEAGAPASGAWGGKVVIIGSSAPSLHDIHPTPLSAVSPGVETLATVIDNALHDRQLVELPRLAQAALGIALCLSVALLAHVRSAAALDPFLLPLPIGLLLLSYLSLNGAPLFLDLHLAAGLLLAFLALLRVWGELRRAYWCTLASPRGHGCAVWPWMRATPWTDTALDRLIDAVARHAPTLRVVVGDAQPRWPGQLRWPELARFAALVGTPDALAAARTTLEPAVRALARHSGDVSAVPAGAARGDVAAMCLKRWAALQNSVTTGDEETP